MGIDGLKGGHFGSGRSAKKCLGFLRFIPAHNAERFGFWRLAPPLQNSLAKEGRSLFLHLYLQRRAPRSTILSARRQLESSPQAGLFNRFVLKLRANRNPSHWQHTPHRRSLGNPADEPHVYMCICIYVCIHTCIYIYIYMVSPPGPTLLSVLR